jgi:hypothetical protein
MPRRVVAPGLRPVAGSLAWDCSFAEYRNITGEYPVWEEPILAKASARANSRGTC